MRFLGEIGCPPYYIVGSRSHLHYVVGIVGGLSHRHAVTHRHGVGGPNPLDAEISLYAAVDRLA